MNWRLAAVMFAIIASVVIGVLFTLALLLGYNGVSAVIGAAVLGFLLALPVTYLVTKRLMSLNARDRQIR